jgi:hypothetical protein
MTTWKWVLAIGGALAGLSYLAKPAPPPEPCCELHAGRKHEHVELIYCPHRGPDARQFLKARLHGAPSPQR